MENDLRNNKRYTLATRNVDLEGLIVTGVFITLMIVWACLTSDKRFLFIPLLFLAVSVGTFISLLFKYFTEPKIAIQADRNGIYFYYRNKKEVYIDYNDIVEFLSIGVTDRYGRLLIKTESNEYKSITTYELNDKLSNLVKSLLDADNKEEYLIKNEVKNSRFRLT